MGDKKSKLTRDNTDTRGSIERGVKNAVGQTIHEQQKLMAGKMKDQYGKEQVKRFDHGVKNDIKRS
jgi:hypothetical protein